MGRKPKWTRELIIQSAKRYSTRADWEKGDRNAYNACQKRGWLQDPEIVGHFRDGKKGRKSKWTRERIIQSAKRYQTRGQWQKGDPRAYDACRKRGWLSDPEIVGHFRDGKKGPEFKWTREMLIQSARRYSTLGEWQQGDPAAYYACQRRGWLRDPEITGHFKQVLEDWDYDKIKASARRYDTRGEWNKGDPKAYKAAWKRGLLDDPEITGHFKNGRKRIKKWTRELIIQSARRYNTRGEWQKGDPQAYQAAHRGGLLNDPAITGHFKQVLEDWDYDKIKASARRYNTRGEWQNGDPNAYNAAWKRGLLDDPAITGHMREGIQTDADAVYVYRFEIARQMMYKIGLTSIRLGTQRVEGTMRKAGATAYDVQIWPVQNAYKTEKKMLELGQPQNVYRGDGHTEMRILTGEELRQVRQIAESESLSDGESTTDTSGRGMDGGEILGLSAVRSAADVETVAAHSPADYTRSQTALYRREQAAEMGGAVCGM